MLCKNYVWCNYHAYKDVVPAAGPPANSSVAGTAAQAKSLAGSSQKQQPTPADQHTEQQHQGHIPQPEETQHSNQDASQQQQQYSQEDWNAYWQYYGKQIANTDMVLM